MYKRIVKHLALILVTASYTVSAYAVAPGFYMGFMAGPANNGASTEQAQVKSPPPPPIITTPANPKSSQFGSRIYIGNKFNSYASFEGGFTYYSGINYDTKGVDTCASTSARVRSIDFVMKGEYTYANSVGVFGKAGAAYTYATASGAFFPTFTILPNGQSQSCGKSTYTTKVAPTFSVGASYDINQNWVVDASWNRLFVGSVINNMTMYALGISYHFVDKYCGQFLCED